jgi:hypothetical protein
VSVLRSALSAVAFLCALGFATGCGAGDSGVEPASSPTATQASLEARRAVADPASSASVAVRYWQSIQQGALPSSLSIYSANVIDAVGVTNFAGTLAAQRPLINDSRLHVIAIDDAFGGNVIRAEALPKVGTKTEHSFFVRRQQNRWRLLYDTLTAAAIQQYVQNQVQRGIDINADEPSSRAIRAGDSALRAYRRSSLSLIRRGVR